MHAYTRTLPDDGVEKPVAKKRKRRFRKPVPSDMAKALAQPDVNGSLELSAADMAKLCLQLSNAAATGKIKLFQRHMVQNSNTCFCKW